MKSTVKAKRIAAALSVMTLAGIGVAIATPAKAAISATIVTCKGTSDFCSASRNSAASQRAVMSIKLSGSGMRTWYVIGGGKTLCSGSIPANGVMQSVGCNIPAGSSFIFKVNSQSITSGTMTVSLNS